MFREKYKENNKINSLGYQNDQWSQGFYRRHLLLLLTNIEILVLSFSAFSPIGCTVKISVWFSMVSSTFKNVYARQINSKLEITLRLDFPVVKCPRL